jgi:organic hydroperoxide reductase OsmC/OhrA
VPSANETSFQTRVRWAGSHAPGPLGPRSYTRDLLVEPEGKPPIAGSASARYFGDDARYNPEDLMLASLGECHLLTYLALAAKAGIHVTALRAVVTGTLGKIEGKVRFREATLHVTTEIDGGADADHARQLHEAAHENCFMASSVNFPLRVEATVTNAGSTDASQPLPSAG